LVEGEVLVTGGLNCVNGAYPVSCSSLFWIGVRLDFFLLMTKKATTEATAINATPAMDPAITAMVAPLEVVEVSSGEEEDSFDLLESEEVPPAEEGEEVSGTVEEVPSKEEGGEVSGTVEEVPTIVEEVPTIVEEVPTIVEEVPTIVEEVPTIVEVPSIVEEVPSIVEVPSEEEGAIGTRSLHKSL